MTERELAWAAGLFEGEGSVRINPPTRSNMGHLCAQVSNTDPQIIEFFQSRWPGHAAPVKGLKAHHNPAWYWIIAAQRAAAFLRQIAPYVRTDRTKARIIHGLQYQAGKTRETRINRTLEYAEAQWAGHVVMRERANARYS